MVTFDLKIKTLHGVDIYQNNSSETLYIQNYRPIIKSKIKTEYLNEDEMVRVFPYQYYAHLPINDEGVVYVADESDIIVKKLHAIITERIKSISLKGIAILTGSSNKLWQYVDVEVQQIADLLRSGDILIEDTERIEIAGLILSDIGSRPGSQLFSIDELLSKDAEQIITERFIKEEQGQYPSDIVKRINAEEINTSLAEIEELIKHEERGFFSTSNSFHSRLIQSYNTHRFLIHSHQYFFRAKINNIVSPVIEIHKTGRQLKYFIAKRTDFEDFLKTVRNQPQEFTKLSQNS